ncbi:uncharacterized protein J3R85_014375 [Psidium guajava]|nr:uncharacterized protein J3R85_014375 [Psidium guajava]
MSKPKHIHPRLENEFASMKRTTGVWWHSVIIPVRLSLKGGTISTKCIVVVVHSIVVADFDRTLLQKEYAPQHFKPNDHFPAQVEISKLRLLHSCPRGQYDQHPSLHHSIPPSKGRSHEHEDSTHHPQQRRKNKNPRPTKHNQAPF